MNHYISPFLVYIINTIDNISFMFITFGIIGGTIAGIFAVFKYFDISDYGADEDDKRFLNKMKYFVILALALIIIGAFLPSKETCVEMIIADKATKENIEIVKQDVIDLIDYIDEKLDD